MRTHRANLPHRGFTLFEVLLVIIIVGVLVAFITPTFSSAFDRAELDESARRMRALVAMLRAQAMNESRIYRIAFRPDGTLKITRQLDPLYAPHIFSEFDEYWLDEDVLMERVWVDELLELPEGPPPIDVEDDEIDFEEFDEEENLPIPIGDYTEDVIIDFKPNGLSGSARWVLRDTAGFGFEMTLDGRLGRISRVEIERLPEDTVEKPEPGDFGDEDEPSEAELIEEYVDSARNNPN